MTTPLDMPFHHAVAEVDHHKAQVLKFVSPQVIDQKVHEHFRFTRQHHSGVRSEHEFFSDLCDALRDVAEVLVAGGHTSLADFRHYVDKHRPETAARIVGYEVVDQPSENQLVAMAREKFAALDRLSGFPPLPPVVR